MPAGKHGSVTQVQTFGGQNPAQTVQGQRSPQRHPEPRPSNSQSDRSYKVLKPFSHWKHPVWVLRFQHLFPCCPAAQVRERGPAADGKSALCAGTLPRRPGNVCQGGAGGADAGRPADLPPSPAG